VECSPDKSDPNFGPLKPLLDDVTKLEAHVGRNQVTRNVRPKRNYKRPKVNSAPKPRRQKTASKNAPLN